MSRPASERIFGGVVGLVLGVLAGLVVALLTWGRVDFLVAFAGVLAGSTVAGVFWPGPFKFLGELVLGVLSDLF